MSGGEQFSSFRRTNFAQGQVMNFFHGYYSARDMDECKALHGSIAGMLMAEWALAVVDIVFSLPVKYDVDFSSGLVGPVHRSWSKD